MVDYYVFTRQDIVEFDRQQELFDNLKLQREDYDESYKAINITNPKMRRIDGKLRFSTFKKW